MRSTRALAAGTAAVAAPLALAVAQPVDAAVPVAAVSVVAVPVVAVSEGAATSSLDHEVIGRTTHADGSITETIVMPAPGYSAATLAERLTRGTGTRFVVLTPEAEARAAAGVCSNGSARSWPSNSTCFVKWSKQGNTRPQLNFKDSSSSVWPVGRAVARWNEVSGIDSVYRTSSCPSNVHCIPVKSGDYGATGWVGLTNRTLASAGYYAKSASIKLNGHYSGTEAMRWNVACHEAGHVLGLGHNVSTGSCMYYQQSSVRYPTSQDEGLIERYY